MLIYGGEIISPAEFISCEFAEGKIIVGYPDIAAVGVAAAPAVLAEPCAVMIWLDTEILLREAVIPAGYGDSVVGKPRSLSAVSRIVVAVVIL